MSHDHHEHAPKWKHDGVRVIPCHTLDPNTAQTPGMDRKAAINFARVGAQKIWAGTVSIQPNAKTGAHHHGELESVIYVVRGKARMRWGDHLEFVAEGVRAILSMCRRSCRTRKSMRARMSRLNVSLCAATTKWSWLISTSSRSRSPSKLRGLIRSIRAKTIPVLSENLIRRGFAS
jgi:hypothetical protein